MDSRYQNGKIYKVVDVGYNKCYVGSTCDKLLSQRMSRHRMKFYRYKNGVKLDTTSSYLFEEFGVDNCKIELIEHYPCNSKEELLKREGFHIQNTDCINRCVAGRTSKEWMEDNKDYIREYKKKWHQEHKEEVLERVKEYYENNKEYVSQYQKEYRQRNKETLLKQKREYYEKKKDERSKQVECNMCKQLIRNDYMKKHQQTVKCQSYKSNNNETTEDN